MDREYLLIFATPEVRKTGRVSEREFTLEPEKVPKEVGTVTHLELKSTLIPGPKHPYTYLMPNDASS